MGPPKIVMPENSPYRADLADRLDIIAELPELFRKVTEKNSCNFVDAGQHITCSKIDGLHLDADMHKKLGEILKIEILKMLQ